jgi:caspase domain-containing protein
MRIAAWAVLLGTVSAWLWIGSTPGASVDQALSPGVVQLELPELGERRYAPGVLRIPEPEKLRRIVLHIPMTRVHQAFPKINTIGTGLVQTIRARQDEVLCDIDLSLHEGRFYALSPADNTVEIKVVPKPGAEPLYAKWVIAPPKEAQAWQTHQRVAGGDGSPAPAEMSAEGLIVMEELEDGRLVKLDKGITTARRVLLQARFARREESVSLRVHWVGEEGAEKTFSVGTWQSGSGARGVKALGPGLPTLAGAVDLVTGQNRLDVEVVHGYTTLYRGTYKIVRRLPSSPTAVTGEKWAVVIGISDYRTDNLDLQFAHRDAEAIRDFLIGKGGFRPDRVRLLTNQNATYQGIRTALFSFLAATQPDDLVLIFLAGHGVQDAVNTDNYFFLAHDSEVGNLGGTAIPMWDLGNVMDYTIRSQRILVFADTCHSGAVSDMASDGGRLNFFNKYLEVLARKKGRLVVTASQAHESSLEKPNLAHGVFTHSILFGLGGAADDNPADGVITAGELVDYVRAKVPDETAGEQHPSYSEQGFDMNLPLAYVRPQQTSKH